jgi:hypothetical protein
LNQAALLLFVCCLFDRRAPGADRRSALRRGADFSLFTAFATPTPKIGLPPIAQGCCANVLKNSSKLVMMRYGV